MKKFYKILLILGASLFIVGGILFTIGMFFSGWSFNGLSNVDYERKTYEINSNSVENIVIEVDTENVEFITVEGDKITVEYSNVKNKKGNTLSEIIPEIDGNTLILKEFDKKFALTFSFFSSNNKMTVKLPSNKALSIKVETSTGDVLLGEQNNETTYSNINVETNTGDFKVLGKVNCLDNFSVELDTGSIITNGEIICKNNLYFEVDTGKINVNSKITATGVSFTADTGKIVIGGFINANSISFETDTGDVICESLILANTITASADTGDVTLILKGDKSDYSYFYEKATGKSNIPAYSSGSRTIKVKTDTGDINISFKE